MWREAMVAGFRVLSQYLSGGTKELRETPHNIRYLRGDTNWDVSSTK
jgi:hypothetical protein